MPKKVERALRREARRRGYSQERSNAFVYGTMRHRFGWKPKKRKK